MNYNINKSNNQVPKGYKKTKVGVIPEDWEVVKLGSVCEKNAKYGINAPAVEFDKNLPVYLRITDIDEKGNFNPNKISSVKDDEYKKFILQENELVLARTGATVGKSYLYNKKDGELVYAGFLIKISPDLTKLNSVFLKNYLNTSLYWHWVKIMSVRSGQPGINAEEYSILPIPLPPLKEQKKIANILTTWDDAISQQDELIKAKEELKKGLMQKLLSGEVRFEGFDREWEEISLKEALIERKTYSEKGLEFVHVSLTKEGVVPKSDRYERDFLVKDDNKKYKITYLNDICYNPANLKFGVICKNTLGTAIFSPIYITFELNKNHNIDFFGYLLTTNDFINRVRKYEQGTVYERMAVSPKDFLSYKLKLPSKQEQQKIAEVLSNADKEIELLKNELEELKEQKKGLMQKLLTGEVRVRV